MSFTVPTAWILVTNIPNVFQTLEVKSDNFWFRQVALGEMIPNPLHKSDRRETDYSFGVLLLLRFGFVCFWY